MEAYLAICTECGSKTSKKYARAHAGLCRSCVNPKPNTPTREQRILEHGYQAYAREEGHYDFNEDN